MIHFSPQGKRLQVDARVKDGAYEILCEVKIQAALAANDEADAEQKPQQKPSLSSQYYSGENMWTGLQYILKTIIYNYKGCQS